MSPCSENTFPCFFPLALISMLLSEERWRTHESNLRFGKLSIYSNYLLFPACCRIPPFNTFYCSLPFSLIRHSSLMEYWPCCPEYHSRSQCSLRTVTETIRKPLTTDRALSLQSQPVCVGNSGWNNSQLQQFWYPDANVKFRECWWKQIQNEQHTCKSYSSQAPRQWSEGRVTWPIC